MIYKCFDCNRIGFDQTCNKCDFHQPKPVVPIDPRWFSEFKYSPSSVINSIFKSKQDRAQHYERVDAIINKYSELRSPYFVNFLHYIGQRGGLESKTDKYENILLFANGLYRIGFTELKEQPALSLKFVRATEFQMQYQEFVSRVKPHLEEDLELSLASWISEVGTEFRNNLPMFVHLFAGRYGHLGEYSYVAEEIPALGIRDYSTLESWCESKYFELLIFRLMHTLKSFDVTRFKSIYGVDALSGDEFEQFVADLYRSAGYTVSVTPKGADQGADVFAERSGKKCVIQAKRYSNNVGNSAIQQVISAKGFYACDEAVVITNRYFTTSAKELASSSGVQLIDRAVLQQMLDDYNQGLIEDAVNESSSNDKQSESE